MEIIPELGPSLFLTLPFFFALAALWLILWRPLVAYLGERDAHTVGARHAAESLSSQVDTKLQSIEATLAETLSQAKALRHDARLQTLREEAAITAAARQQADARVAEALESLEQSRSAAAVALRQSSAAMSDEIVTTLIGATA